MICPSALYSCHPCRYDSQLQQIDGTLSTIEMQREALEGANTNTAVLTTMNDAAKALKKANNELDVDKVGDKSSPPATLPSRSTT